MTSSKAIAPRVSVIVTVYKRTEFLREALESVLRQNYRNFQIIVADDSGTAAAREIVAACGHCERINYIPNPKTLGIARSITRAVEQAHGDYIAILNDDDLWERDMLETLVAPLEADSRRVLAAADHWLMDAGGQIGHGLSESWSADFGRASLPEGVVKNAAEFVVVNGGAAINIASVFRKDAVDWSLVVPEIAGAYDYWISCLLAATRRPIYYVPKRVARWRVHRGMETARRSHDKGQNMVYIYSTMLKRGWFSELAGILKGKLAEALFVVGRDKLQSNRANEARSYLWRSFLLNPHPRALTRIATSFLPDSICAQLKARLRRRRAATLSRKGSGEPILAKYLLDDGPPVDTSEAIEHGKG